MGIVRELSLAVGHRTTTGLMCTNREALERFLGPPVAHQARRPGWREPLRAADSTAQTEPNRALSPSIATTASRLSDANRSSISSKDQQQPLRVDQIESNSARSRFNALLQPQFDLL